MEPTTRLVLIVAGGEGLLAVAALLWARWSNMTLPLGGPWAGIAGGLLAAAGLLVVNLTLLRWRGNRWPGGSLRYVCRVVVQPLFEHVRPWQIVVISVLAGLGEELLFRGVLQPIAGLTAASLLFGAVHVGGRSFLGYGAWAACIGACMGWLTIESGGLMAPIVAHAVYDALALAYVRFGPTDTL